MIRRVTEAGPEFWTQIAGIHAASFDHGWTADALKTLASAAHSHLHVVEDDGSVVSFILLTVVAGEGEILTIATAPRYRGRGHAGQLLAHVTAALTAEKAEAIFLEVAVDNEAALALYEKAGFEPAGIRKGYYSRAGGPAVDACILRLALA
jgi:ribosomal-protein-alanine N-acetyltransferase